MVAGGSTPKPTTGGLLAGTKRRKVSVVSLLVYGNNKSSPVLV